MEGWLKPISTCTHPEFLAKITQLTTLPCYGAFPTEFVGFHRGECWGESHHSVTVRLALTYRWILIMLISSQDVNPKSDSELFKNVQNMWDIMLRVKRNHDQCPKASEEIIFSHPL